MKENLLKKVKRLSLECKDQDVIGVIMPRLCGVIHAFYIVCSCQSTPGLVVLCLRNRSALAVIC